MQGEGKGGTAWIAVTVTKTEDSQRQYGVAEFADMNM